MTRRLILWSAVPVLMLIGFFLLGAQSADAANRYWTNGGGDNDWGNTANWVASDPGSCTGGGASVPTSSDAVIFDADCDDNVTITAGANPGSITFSAGNTTTATQAGSLDIDGTLGIVSGATLDSNGNDITIAGDWVNQGAYTSGNNTVTFDGSSGDQSLQTGGTGDSQDFYNLVIDNSGGNYVDLQQALDVDNDFTINDSSAQFGAFANMTVSGTFSNNGLVQASPSITATLTNDTDSGEIEIYDDGGGTETGLPFGASYYTLSFGDDSNGTTFTLTEAIDVNGSFEVKDTATLDAAGYNINVAGPWTVPAGGAFTSGSNTVTFDGSVSQNIATGGTDTNHDFYNVVVSNTAADGATLDSAQAMDIDNDLTISSGGAFDLADENLTVGNDFSNEGIMVLTYGETITLTNGMDTDSGTIYYLDDSGSSRTGFNSGLGNTYYSLTLDDDSNSTDLTLNANLDVNGSITISGNYTLAASTYDINVGVDWTDNTGNFDDGSGTVVFDGTGDQTISGTNTFYDLTKQNAGGTFTLPSGVTTTVANDLNISGTTNNINFFSSSATSAATIAYSGTGTVSFLNVRGITNTGTVLSCLTSCQDFSSNSGWVFAEAAQQGSGSTLAFLTVLDPRSGDELAGGSSVEVSYTAVHNDLDSIAVYFSQDGGENYTLLADGLENTGSYMMTVPNETTLKGKVMVAAYDEEGAELFTSASGIFKVAESDGLAEDLSEDDVIELLDELVEELLDTLGDSFDGLTQLLDTGAVTMLDTDGVLRDLSAGSLFRGESLPGVYLINADGSRSVFPNEATFLSHGYSFDDVVMVQDDQLQALPLGDRVRMAQGSLIKVQSDARVFQVGADGEINHVPDEETALSLFGADWNQMITDVNVVFWGDYTVGDSL